MQTIAVCSTKGGVGKTTLATALAVAAAADGTRVALIDVDPQQTMGDWWRDRGEPDNPELMVWDIKLGVRFLPTAIERVAQLGFDLIVLDTPPAIMDIIELAVSQADFVLIPSQPSAADRHGNQAIIEMVKAAGKPFAFVINRVEPRGDKLVAETRRELKQHGPVLQAVVSNRQSFRASIGKGMTGAEAEPRKAGEEVEAVWRAIKRQLRAHARHVA